MLVMEYNNNITGHPAIQGTEITFSCHPGFILLGPNSSTCQDSGQWEPDPKEALCTGLLMMNSMINYLTNNS